MPIEDRGADVTKPLTNESRDWPLLSVAEGYRKTLTTRQKLIPGAPPTMAVWNVLIELYIGMSRGIALCVTDVAAGTGMAPTSTLRWQNYLVDLGLVSRSHDLADKRRIWLRLTETGLRATEEMLADLKQSIR